MNYLWIITVIPTLRITKGSISCQEKTPSFLNALANDTVKVTCPDLEEYSSSTFHLFKDGDKIASGSFATNQSDLANLTEAAFNGTHGAPQFVLHQVMVNRTGLYTCVANTPSPGSWKQTLVFSEETLCSKPTNACAPSSDSWPWAAMFAVTVLTVYGLVITSLTIMIKHKLNHKDGSQNDYMNMKPRGMKSNRKVQRPIRAARF